MCVCVCVCVCVLCVCMHTYEHACASNSLIFKEGEDCVKLNEEENYGERFQFLLLFLIMPLLTSIYFHQHQ